MFVFFKIKSVRDGKSKLVEFERGTIVNDETIQDNSSRKGTKVTFVPDEKLFGNYKFLNDYIEKMMWNYCYLNPGLTIIFNNEKYFSENGLFDLLNQNIAEIDIYDLANSKPLYFQDS